MKISIVCQGPILPFTKAAIKSYRTCFPDAEVILSTWKDQDLTGLNPDKLVTPEDPGPGAKKNNIARQIVGSLAGLKEASCPLAMRVRSDGIFTDNDCINHWNNWLKRSDEFKIFENRLIVPNIGTADPDVHVSFNISEWAILGSKKDLLYLYDIPTAAADMTEKSPEQYIWLSAIQKKMPEVDMPSIGFNNDKLRKQTKDFIANNVVVLDTRRQYKMFCGKHIMVPDDEPVTLKNAKWQRWYSEL